MLPSRCEAVVDDDKSLSLRAETDIHDPSAVVASCVALVDGNDTASGVRADTDVQVGAPGDSGDAVVDGNENTKIHPGCCVKRLMFMIPPRSPPPV